MQKERIILMNTTQFLSLTEAPLGRHMRVRHLHGHPHACQRLRELGLYENTLVRCVIRSDSGVVCEILNTRVGLDAQLASSIFVSATE